MVRLVVRVVGVGLLAAACGSSLTPVEPPSRPGGMIAVPFTLEFEAGHWTPGGHAYRLALECPELGTSIEPPVVRFHVDPAERLFEERVWLRFDGPSTSPLSPANLEAVDPAQTTGAVVTLVGLTSADAELAVADCSATVTYDGGEPAMLATGQPFIP